MSASPPEIVELKHEVAPGVTLLADWHRSDGGYVDIDSIQLSGRPDRIAAYLAENNLQHEDIEDQSKHDLLEWFASHFERGH